MPARTAPVIHRHTDSLTQLSESTGKGSDRCLDPCFRVTVISAAKLLVRGSVGRATDDAGSWLLLTEWESVGAYRRGLGGYQVKLHATPLLSQALDQPSAFEQLLRIEQGGQETARASDRAADADWGARHADSGWQPPYFLGRVGRVGLEPTTQGL